MANYKDIIQKLEENEVIKDNYEQKGDNLIIQLSSTVEIILYKNNNLIEFYINNHYFGTMNHETMLPIFTALLSKEKVFIEYRKPIGIYVKEYFKIETKEWYHKRKQKLTKRRGIKIYDIDEVFLDKY